MTVYIALLRGVNVAGQNRVGMEGLRKFFVSEGFRNVRTYIQSGNVIFEHANIDCSTLERSIKAGLKRVLGVDVDVIVRSGPELERVVRSNPYPNRDESRVHVVFLSGKVEGSPENPIGKAAEDGEAFSVASREVYLFLPNGIGRSKLSNNFFEKTLKMAATTRNLRTTKALLMIAKEGMASKGRGERRLIRN